MTPRAAPPEADQPRRQQQQQEQQGQPDAALTEKQVAAALQCDCVKELREGPCGEGFVQAFGCYLRESADEHARSAACAASMGELRRCMASHPESFGELDVARKVLGVAGVGRGAAAGR